MSMTRIRIPVVFVDITSQGQTSVTGKFREIMAGRTFPITFVDR